MTIEITLFSLILMRMSGLVLLNPVIGRRQIPTLVKGGIIASLTLSIYMATVGQVQVAATPLEFGILLLKEFFVGFALGYVMELFEFVFIYGGSIIDFQMGLSMATIYDPHSNAQMPLTSSIWNAYFIMLFFAVDGHLALMKILLESGQVVPYGQVAISQEALAVMPKLFADCVMLAVKFALPVIAIQFLTEIAVGILMKVIPQINVFVVNIQAKIIIGLGVLLFLFSPMSEFLGKSINQMMLTVQQVLKLM